jgi:hypothetical protein
VTKWTPTAHLIQTVTDNVLIRRVLQTTWHVAAAGWQFKTDREVTCVEMYCA